MSSYDFAPRGGSAGGGTIALGPPAPKGGSAGGGTVKLGPAVPTKVVKVRAHTRTVPVKPSKSSGGSAGGGTTVLGPSVTESKTLGPSVTESTTYKPPRPARTVLTKAAPVKTVPLTQSVRPSETSSAKRYTPNFPKEPIAGYDTVQVNPDGSLAKQGSYQPGVRLVKRPYYTNTNTLAQNKGPAGQESTQWNAATVAKAKQIQVANYGKPGYIARSLVPGGLEGGTTSVTKAIERGAEVASNVLPGGGVGEAAGILGLGLKGLRIVRTGKDVVEAAPAVKDVAEGATAAAHTTEPAAAVRGAMPGAKILRGKQEVGYSVERSKRVAAGRVHLDNPNLSPAERVRGFKREQVGELPKINYKGFHELNDQSVQTLQTDILNHPHLLPFQKIRASDALTNALNGKVPTRGEITLLEHVFGKETTAGLGSIANHPYKDALLNALNIPRSLMASFDLSAPFRQGLMVSTRHPTIFAKNFGSMVKAFGSERVYQGIHEDIRARPTFPLMEAAKLPLTDLGRDVSEREERFASNYAETLTGGKYSPVRASGRAYTGFLDKTRADVFDHLIKSAQSQGINVQDQHFLESLGRYVGSATGRGELRHFKEAAPALNAIFFSPRLMASRFNFLNPAYYARLHPFARKEALRSALQLAGTATTLVGLASQIPGVKVETDPRNPDWGKIKVGNTRLDIGGGFQQELRFLAQIATGLAISSTTGKRLSLTAGGFGQPTRLDIAQRFFMGKESPIASLVTDWLRGSTQIGQKFSWKSEAAGRMTPLLGQDAYDLYKEKHGGMNGLVAALAGYGIGSVGVGVQTYGPAKPKTTGGSSSGGSSYDFTPSGSGGGSSYDFTPSTP